MGRTTTQRLLLSRTSLFTNALIVKLKPHVLKSYCTALEFLLTTPLMRLQNKKYIKFGRLLIDGNFRSFQELEPFEPKHISNWKIRESQTAVDLLIEKRLVRLYSSVHYILGQPCFLRLVLHISSWCQPLVLWCAVSLSRHGVCWSGFVSPLPPHVFRRSTFHAAHNLFWN